MTESSLYQPTPNVSKHSRTPSGSSTNRLLASHHSVLDLLHQKHNNLSNPNTRYSPTLDIHLSAVSSWQSIGEYLTPRPTSSVLSNSDTDDDTYTRHIKQRDVSNSTVHVSNSKLLHSSFIDDENYDEDDESECKDDDDDKKTIEIEMNQGRTNRFTSTTSTSDSSSFIMPNSQIFTDLKKQNNDDTKILIIGHKKSNFFKMLNEPLSLKFTLDIRDSYNIILIIFDGLIKIGNILNFIKQNHDLIQDKLFIPIFKNINQIVINKIIKTYGLNLLCPPINYNNKNQVENLLELLNQDFLLKESFYLQDVPQHEYQLVTIQGNSDILSESIPKQSKVLINSFETSSISLNQLIVKSDSQTRKQRYKKKRSTFVFLTITLSLGIGIGITTAYALSHMFAPIPISEKEIIEPLSANTSKTILKKGIDLSKSNIILFKQSITDVSKLMWIGTKNTLNSMAKNWDKWMIYPGKDSTYSLLWTLF